MRVITSRRSFLRGAVVGTTATLTAKACGNKKELSTNQPNIVFFLVDDQRNDTLGCAGHPIIQTPVIDSLAKKGCRFSNAFVTTSICAASRASILSGLYERTHGYTFKTLPLQEKYLLQSYPVVLQNNGYRTGFIGKLGVKSEGNFLENLFDYFQPLRRNPYFHQLPDGSKRHATDLAADHAIEFIRNNQADMPFCLSVSFNAPHAEDSDKENHYPWPPSTNGMYEDITIPSPQLSEPSIFKSMPKFLQKSMNRDRYFWRWDTAEKYQKNMKAYFRMITGIDFAIGRVIKELEQLNLTQNTVIIYAADNGYYMGNRGFAGKWSHYEESLRIPLIVYDPRIPPSRSGSVEKSIALNIDLPSLIVDLAGIKVPPSYQGRSLKPLIYGINRNWRKDFFCEHLMNHEEIPKWEGVHGKRFVYARYFEQQPVYEFLHDLEVDPNELINFAENNQYHKTLKQMRQRCNELIRKYNNYDPAT